MKNLRDTLLSSKTYFRFPLLVAMLFTLGAVTLISRAAAPLLTITVVNNSSWEIRHLYLSRANNDNWGPDQLNQSSISPGAPRTLSVSWDQATVKLVGEDQDGCFLSTTVDASGNPVWTISSDAPLTAGTNQRMSTVLATPATGV